MEPANNGNLHNDFYAVPLDTQASASTGISMFLH